MSDESVVRFHEVIPGYYRPGKGYHRGHLHVSVRGHLIKWDEGRGWQCSCTPDADCQHVDLVRSLVRTQDLERRRKPSA